MAVRPSGLNRERRRSCPSGAVNRYLSGGPVLASIARTPATPTPPTDSDPDLNEALRRVRGGEQQ